MEEWKKFKQGDSLFLTWGFNKEWRDQTLPFGKLDKKMLGKKPKHRSFHIYILTLIVAESFNDFCMSMYRVR